tara:strand:+ start:30 stop:404 length:375 start_codon:yes stop_codon:yes gene_type:complete
MKSFFCCIAPKSIPVAPKENDERTFEGKRKLAPGTDSFSNSAPQQSAFGKKLAGPNQLDALLTFLRAGGSNAPKKTERKFSASVQGYYFSEKQFVEQLALLDWEVKCNNPPKNKNREIRFTVKI